MGKLIALATLLIVAFASLAQAGDVTIGTITKTPKPGGNSEVLVEGTLTLGATETWNGWSPYMLKPDGVTVVAVIIVEFTQPQPGQTKNFKYKQLITPSD
ncbi:MAG: hypothetical protein L0Z62_20785, partial [Gemmataceae bacterium]|nr:hypothetical protein [Gemmataceae bacterium]